MSDPAMALPDCPNPIDRIRVRVGDLGALTPGTHLAVATLTPEPRWHQCIYVGKAFNGDPLVAAHLAFQRVAWDPTGDHLVMHMLPGGNVMVDTLEDFIGVYTKDVYRLTYSDSEAPDALSESVRRASEALHQKPSKVFHTGRRFAVYCRTGECVDDKLAGQSSQVRALLSGVSVHGDVGELNKFRC